MVSSYQHFSSGGGAVWDAMVPLRDGVQLAEVHHWGQTIEGQL